MLTVVPTSGQLPDVSITADKFPVLPDLELSGSAFMTVAYPRGLAL